MCCGAKDLTIAQFYWANASGSERGKTDAEFAVSTGPPSASCGAGIAVVWPGGSQPLRNSTRVLHHSVTLLE